MNITDILYAKKLSGGGGGGGGDFSTAKLTIVNNTPSYPEFHVPQILEGIADFLYYPDPGTSNIDVILYDGGATAELPNVTSFEGDIEYTGDENFYIISGDCKVILSNVS